MHVRFYGALLATIFVTYHSQRLTLCFWHFDLPAVCTSSWQPCMYIRFYGALLATVFVTYHSQRSAIVLMYIAIPTA